MGDVISMQAQRSRRDRQANMHAAAAAGVPHPSLRWLAGNVWFVAHRRSENGGAVCGQPGDLSLAVGGVPLCTTCFPRARAERTGTT